MLTVAKKNIKQKKGFVQVFLTTAVYNSIPITPQVYIVGVPVGPQVPSYEGIHRSSITT